MYEHVTDRLIWADAIYYQTHRYFLIIHVHANQCFIREHIFSLDFSSINAYFTPKVHWRLYKFQTSKYHARTSHAGTNQWCIYIYLCDFPFSTWHARPKPWHLVARSLYMHVTSRNIKCCQSAGLFIYSSCAQCVFSRSHPWEAVTAHLLRQVAQELIIYEDELAYLNSRISNLGRRVVAARLDRTQNSSKLFFPIHTRITENRKCGNSENTRGRRCVYLLFQYQTRILLSYEKKNACFDNAHIVRIV